MHVLDSFIIYPIQRFFIHPQLESWRKENLLQDLQWMVFMNCVDVAFYNVVKTWDIPGC